VRSRVAACYLRWAYRRYYQGPEREPLHFVSFKSDEVVN
jgi:hypothetical protein